MKRLLITIGLIVHGLTYALNDQTNLEKYWKFRNSFREKFVKIGPLQGESLPATSKKSPVKDRGFNIYLYHSYALCAVAVKNLS